jgi:hypothetical protein
MSLGARDAEAFEFANLRIFSESAFTDRFLVGLDLEMQTRRLTLNVYGLSLAETTPNRFATPNVTFVYVVTFFGVADLALAQGSEGGAFPQSARIDGLSLAYDDDADLGHVHVAGTRGWTLDFAFDGMAIEETPGTVLSLVDDDA